jgi:hypothetical protein
MATIAIPSPPPIDAAANVGSLRTLGTGAQQAAAGNDARLGTPTNAVVTPTANKIPLADPSGVISIGWLPSSGVAAGTYTNATVMVDAHGIVTSAASGTAPATGTGTAGQAAFWQSSSVLAGSNNFFWDAGNSRLGIGTNAPAVTLDVVGAASFTGNVVLGGTPTLSSHAVNKGYVDAIAQGLSPKSSAWAMSTTNVASLSGTQTLDGQSVAAGKRVLLTGQSTASQNGLWFTAAGAWTRPTDFATGAGAGGTYVFIEKGTLYADTGWVCTTDPPTDIVDTDSLVFAQFAGAGTYTAGAGLTLTGTQFSMPNVGTSGLKTFATGDSITTDTQGRVSAATTVTRTLTAGVGLTGGGTLAADRSFAVDQSFSPTWTGIHTYANYQDLATIAVPANPSSGFVRLYGYNRTTNIDSLSFTTPGGNQIIIGRDVLVGVRNVTGSTLVKGSVVYISGSSAGLAKVDLAKADASMTKLPALGIVQMDIPQASNGYVMARGVLTNISTSGWAAGDTLYVDPVTAGALTNVEPVHPQVSQAVGTVEVVSGSNGVIVVAVVPINLHRLDGVNGTSWSIGDGTGAAARTVLFKNANTGTLTWTPTTTRTLTLPDATDTLVGKATTDVLTNKTISGASNTLSNIANASLVNSSLTVTAGTGLTGGGSVSLGGSTTISMPATGPGAGTSTFATGDSLTIDSQGRVTAIGTVTRTLTGGTGINAIGTLAADRTVSIDQAFSPTWTGAHTWSTGTASFAASAAKILNGAGTFTTSLATNATANRTVTFPDATMTVVGQANTQTLTNKTIDGASNTLSNIANASLTNSTIGVLAGTGLTGGGTPALGSSATISMPATGPGAGTIGGGTSVVTSVTLDAQGRVTAATAGAATPVGSRSVDTQLTTTSPTTIATYTPGTTKGLWLGLYYRVVTATTNVTISVTYTDPTTSQVMAVQPITATTVGSYALAPIFILSTAAAVTITVTAGTANQVFCTASIVEA